MKIYVASSWRNQYQPGVVEALREAGHEVYDFRNPSKTDHGFSWAEIDTDWENWSNEEYLKALENPIAQRGFDNDFNGMCWADVCVMVMPCGRSAHTEAGWMQGSGRPTIVLLLDDAEPELMYKIYPKVCTDFGSVLQELKFMEENPELY